MAKTDTTIVRRRARVHAQVAEEAAAAVILAKLAEQSPDDLERQRADLVKKKLLLVEEVARQRLSRANGRPSTWLGFERRIAELKLDLAQVESELAPLSAAIKERGERRASRRNSRFVDLARERLDPDLFRRLLEDADEDGGAPEAEAAE